MPGKLGTILKLLVGAASVAALAAVWPSSERSELPESRIPASSNAKEVYSPPTDENRFYLPKAGRRYVYKFDRKIRFQGEIAGQTLPEVGYSGDFFVDVLRSDNRSFEALLSQKIPNAGNKVSPFLRIEASARGDSAELFISRGLDEDETQHVSILKDLASLWLFPLRSDTVGAFEARFDSLPAEDGVIRERKAKLAYRKGSTVLPEILSSLHLLRWDSEHRLPGELKGAETTRMGRDATAALTAESRYGLALRSVEEMPSYSRDLLSRLSSSEGLQLASTKPDMSQHPDYAKLNWNDLMLQLRSIDRIDGNQQLELFGDLLKFLRMHPDKTGELAALLRDQKVLKAGIQSPLFKTLVGTLATLGTTESLSALRDAYDDNALPDNARGTILASLTTTQAPIDSATREFLAQKMQSERDPHLSQAAAFALGSALQQSGNDSQSQRSIAQIEQAWAASTSQGDRLALLDVMGNSGRVEFYPSVQAVISSNAHVAQRARAVFSLRFMTSAEAGEELVRRLQDPAPEVRAAAANAIELASWREAFRAPLESCSGREAVARTQETCRRVLGEHEQVAGN